ncbi:MAG: esterase, partial [Bacteroidales bacterium]|nr:esterase [Bacteroidales bacterium]
MKKLFTFFAILLLATVAMQAQELANFGRGPQIVSPDIQGDSVTFNLKADYATIVKFSGSWLNGGPVDMKRGANNVWSIKLPCPRPEIHTYNFIVDGVAMNDPQNILVQRDGTRYLNMLIVPGERSENYYEANQHGSVTTRWYDSPSLGYSRRMVVYTPYGYEKSKAKLPVLYLLHGGGGDEEAWTSMGRAAQILDNLI